MPSATVECVKPVFTAGSAGIGTLLAGRIAADSLVVNGYDVLKLQNELLDMLARRGVPANEIRAAIERSKPDKQLKLQLR